MLTEHQYTICLKKEDLRIYLASDDVYFISRQMDKWCQLLMDESYIPVSLPKKTPEKPQPPAEKVTLSEPKAQPQEPPDQTLPNKPEPSLAVVTAPPKSQPAIEQEQPASQQQEAQPAETAKVTPSETETPKTAETSRAVAEPEEASPVISTDVEIIQAQPKSQEESLPERPELQQQPVQPTPSEKPAQVQKNTEDDTRKLSSVNLPLMTGGEPIESPPSSSSSDKPADKQAEPSELQQVMTAVTASPLSPVSEHEKEFDAVVATLMEDLEKEPSKEELEASEQEGSTKESQPSQDDDEIDALLNNNMDTLPDLGLVNSLDDLCEHASANSSEDYLLLSAYYLSIVEHQATFSLRQVNTNLVNAGLTPVNHSTLETALSKAYFSMLPDLTGMAEVTEYTITPEGQQATLALFK